MTSRRLRDGTERLGSAGDETPMKSASPTEEEIHRRIVSDASDAIVFADASGRIRLWNAGAESIFGYAASEALGQSLDLIVPEKQRARHWDGYHRVMETGASRYGARDRLSVPALRKDGSRVSIEFTIVLVLGGDGKPAGIAAILRDVSESWNRERELRARIRELEAKRAADPS
jgi:PAS domain S-box-containing protein